MHINSQKCAATIVGFSHYFSLVTNLECFAHVFGHVMYFMSLCSLDMNWKWNSAHCFVPFPNTRYQMGFPVTILGARIITSGELGPMNYLWVVRNFIRVLNNITLISALYLANQEQKFPGGIWKQWC